jgi:transcriptional regulator with XRE-family HTH domain
MKTKPLTSYLTSNLKFLREKKGVTQQALSEQLDMSRSKLNSYENGVNNNPPAEDLMRFSDLYKISIDTLLRVDLLKLSETKFKELQAGNDSFITGTNLRVLSTTVDKNNKENIEFVPLKAKAGYLAGFHDSEFINSLPTFHLPILKNDKKHRLFPVTGDSMLPFPENAFMIGEYMENWTEIKDGEKCLVISKEQGFVLKEVYNQLKKNKTLLLKSTNPIYSPYEIQAQDILEVWKFKGYVEMNWPQQYFSPEVVLNQIDKFKEGILKLASR